MNQSDNQPSVLALGEILWDLFPDGPRLGGAPANFACHVAGMGAESFLISAVGDDPAGHEAIAKFKQLSVRTGCIQIDPQHPTGSVNVELDAEGVASFHFADNCAWDHIKPSDSVLSLAARSQAICFGTLGQRSQESRDSIQQIIKTFRGRTGAKPCVLDINFRPPFVDLEVIKQSLELANILKLNETELAGLSQQLFGISLTGTSDDEIRPVLTKLTSTFGLKWIALTLGEAGAVLWHRDGKLFRSPSLRVTVKDTVGAGDAFTATLVVGLLTGQAPQRIVERACEVAAYVCANSGATPPLPQFFRFSG